jgi:arsenate reductase
MAPLSILFVCIGNSCRSPMAEAIARHLGGRRVDARSAGLAPAGFVAGGTLTTLDALGYSGEGLWSKGLDDVLVEDLDIVVSLLGNQAFDLLPHGTGARRETWAVFDPFGEDEEVYLEVARELEVRIRALLSEELDGELFLS